MTNPADEATFTPLSTYALSTAYADFSYTFNNNTTDNFIAFKHGGGAAYRTIFIDDILWEPTPAAAPECITDLNVTTNTTCGNFANIFEWAAVPGAEGYKVRIGTEVDGGGIVVDNVNVNNTLTYSFVGNPGTTYYYKVTPYNGFGDAISCPENDNFTTFSEGCYCVSIPSNVDGSGITNVTIGDTDFENSPGTYGDFTQDGAVEISRGVDTTLDVTFGTGYAYKANVWIDLNDNYTFESSELVATGLSSNVNGTVLDLSFLTELGFELGEHRMRISAATAGGQSPPNPCYNGSFGVTVDFLVNVLEAPSCLPPRSSTVTNITANSAQLNWIADAVSYNIEYGISPFEQGDGSGDLLTGVTGSQTVLSDLEVQADYSYYIQSNCEADGSSSWSGPYTFKTACDSFGDFEENFSTETAITAPECWYTLKNTTVTSSYVKVITATNLVEFYNAGDANGAFYLITPSLTDLATGDHRVKFKARSFSAVSLIVGTMTDPNDEATFTAVETVPMTSAFTEYLISFASPLTDSHVAFKFVGNVIYQSVYFDDFLWEAIPTAAPSCLSDISVAIDPSCGNFASTFNWSPVAGADSYNLKIGTTSGAGEIINVGNVNSYNFVGTLNTTYFFTVFPVNAFGAATGCEEGTFTTVAEGCYCESIPDSEMDGDGITNITIGTTNYTVPAETYVNLTASEAAGVTVGENSINAITFATGYGYDMHIWVDWNDDFTFGEDEKMFTGASLDQYISVVDASFIIPANAPLGVHRMRIGSAFNGQETADPCYNGYYGITVDLNIEVLDNLGTVDFDKKTLVIYPNPVKDILNVSFTQNVSDVTVYNLLGQQVLFLNMNANKGQVDMSSLTSGTYLLKVNTESGLQTMKIIKE